MSCVVWFAQQLAKEHGTASSPQLAASHAGQSAFMLFQGLQPAASWQSVQPRGHKVWWQEQSQAAGSWQPALSAH